MSAIRKIKRNLAKPYNLTDSGLEWCGIKIFLLIPVNAGPPKDIAANYRNDIKKMVERYGQVTIRDIYETEILIRKKIENGEPLIAN